ncbi:diguanylate cyclase domain-containing protein [Streptomyces sp. NPDC057690]|uniref:diguanylate cyclase domain-containing protein n=1 Tax=Streptomyces sp. NPDC057690 TaxID=3346214 RepID=UPI0036C216A2
MSTLVGVGRPRDGPALIAANRSPAGWWLHRERPREPQPTKARHDAGPANRFKTLNDTHGHAAGDAALVATADRLRTWCGRNGTAGRLGGDEFVAVVQDLVAADLDALTAALHRPLHYDGMSLPLAASVGACTVAELPVPVLPDALTAADAAMYAAKGRGRRSSRTTR